MNSFTICGTCVNKPEIKKTQNGYNFTVLVLKDDRTTNDGKVEDELLSIVAWGNLAEEVVEKAISGSFVSARGRISDTSYDKDGEKIYRSELVADKVKFY